MEREPRPISLAERIQMEFGPDLESQITALKSGAGGETLPDLLKNFEAILVEESVEFDANKRKQLRDIVIGYKKELNLSDEE